MVKLLNWLILVKMVKLPNWLILVNIPNWLVLVYRIPFPDWLVLVKLDGLDDTERKGGRKGKEGKEKVINFRSLQAILIRTSHSLYISFILSTKKVYTF